MKFGNWTVCETDDDVSTEGFEVYAEHVEGCNNENGLNPDQASWSWEFDDYPHSDQGYETCWGCGTKVPEEAVALVQLHNWNRSRRE